MSSERNGAWVTLAVVSVAVILEFSLSSLTVTHSQILSQSENRQEAENLAQTIIGQGDPRPQPRSRLEKSRRRTS